MVLIIGISSPVFPGPVNDTWTEKSVLTALYRVLVQALRFSNCLHTITFFHPLITLSVI